MPVLCLNEWMGCGEGVRFVWQILIIMLVRFAYAYYYLTASFPGGSNHCRNG